MKNWHVLLVLLCLCAAAWWWLYSTISFSADQIFLGDTPLQGAAAPLAVAAMYFLILPGAAIALIVLLLLQSRR
jgi:hypothetical protein